MASLNLVRSAIPLCLAILILTLFSPAIDAVNRDVFRTCPQSGFCTRNRAYADHAGSTDDWVSPYGFDPDSIRFKDGKFSATILKTISADGETVRLPHVITFLESGSVRITIDEEKRQKGDIELRHGSKARKERFNEVEKWAIVGSLKESKTARIKEKSGIPDATVITYGPDNRFEAIIHHFPFSVEFRRDGETHIKVNDRGLLNVEHWRRKTEKVEGQESVVDDSNWWEESFGGNTDSKPRGPESVALDVSFPHYEHVFGIPSHASSLSLKETRGGEGNYDEPYRLYNADVFEYELDNPMTLYGSIPFMQAHRKGSTVGVFWMNSAETWIDIVKSRPSTNPLSLGTKSQPTTQTHWISETGLVDLFVFMGPTPEKVLGAYAELTGYTALPQHFAIGYHQCRWNYNTDQDVMNVVSMLESYEIPFDTIWLDIEYTDQKKYFTWHPEHFSDLTSMHEKIDHKRHKLVTIIDPHIKNEAKYPVVEELRNSGYGVCDKNGELFEAHCWPGASHWVDGFNSDASKWWAGWFAYNKFNGSAPDTFIWNDMNEPSVFNGPDTTMPKDNLHHGGWEHRDVHNLYGFTFSNATFTGLLDRDDGDTRRPFTLTRSFFSGSQRVAAMWTGDNLARWDHLEASIPMILSQGIAGFPFAGADIGGFFGNPSPELQTRWYQAGIFYPFMRAHAHIETRRREPYLLESPYLEIVTSAIQTRYQLLPAWYTAFHEASTTGAPIVRPNFYVHPEDEHGFGIDDQLYLGSSGLLAKPVVREGSESVDVYLGDNEVYYDYFNAEIYSGRGHHTIPAPLDKIPLLLRGGHILPTKLRVRLSSQLMHWDPYTLFVAVGKSGKATGSLYFDDGETYAYRSGAFIHQDFFFDEKARTLKSVARKGEKRDPAYADKMARVRIERIVIVGASLKDWKKVEKVEAIETMANGKTQSVGDNTVTIREPEGKRAARVIIKDPKVSVARDWVIKF